MQIVEVQDGELVDSARPAAGKQGCRYQQRCGEKRSPTKEQS
jgi:hypothetical protein